MILDIRRILVLFVGKVLLIILSFIMILMALLNYGNLKTKYENLKEFTTYSLEVLGSETATLQCDHGFLTAVGTQSSAPHIILDQDSPVPCSPDSLEDNSDDSSAPPPIIQHDGDVSL